MGLFTRKLYIWQLDILSDESKDLFLVPLSFSFDVLLQSGKIDHRSGTCPVRSSPVASLRDLRHNHHTIAV